MRMMPAAPYTRHCSPAAMSFAGSHDSAAFRPSAVTGMLETSPFGGVIIRHRQSSVTTATQYPVKSVGAAARAVGGAEGAFCANAGAALASARTAKRVRIICRRLSSG